MQHHHRLFTQVVKDGGGFFKKQWQVVLDACCGHAIAHVFVNAASGGVAIQEFTPAAAKQRTRGLIHGELSTRQQTHLGHGVEAALGVGVKGAYGVDFIVKQIHPVWHQGTHGEQVDQAPAHRVFARADHLRHMAVTRHGQLLFQLSIV